VGVQGDQFGNQRGKPLVFSFGPSVLDRDIAALLIAEVVQALPKWLYEVGLESRRGVSHEPYAVHRSRQLRPHRQGPRERGAQADEKFPACAHSITLSARAPSTWEVLHLSRAKDERRIRAAFWQEPLSTDCVEKLLEYCGIIR